MSKAPAEAPPSYAQATGSSKTTTSSSRLQVPQSHNGIPAAHRRSMEDETRPLPPGWLRQWDSTEQHQYFVDTNTNPPRSIWHHPHDDGEYLKTLSSEERERIQEEDRLRHERPVDLTDDESMPSRKGGSTATSTGAGAAAGMGDSSGKSKGKESLGRKLKDKVTGKTHEERETERVRRAEEEQQYYEAHMKFRAAMQQAQMTGQPQLLGKDRDGKDVYIEPPQQGGMYGGGVGGGYGNRGYGYNPYQSGPYANPNARFIRPPAPYGRPYGGGYGGGYGFPIAGGLLGGMLLGGMLF